MKVLVKAYGSEAKFCSQECFVFAMVYSTEDGFDIPGYSTNYEDEGKENYVDVGESLDAYLGAMRSAAKKGEAIVKSESC